MSGLCGWFEGGRSAASDPRIIDTMAATLERFDRTAVRRESADWGAIAADGDVFQDADRLAAVSGRMRFTDPQLAELARRHGPAYALAEGYVTRQGDVLQALAGSFSLALLHRRSGEALLAVDRMATRPLCYAAAGGKLVFGSTLDAIGEYPGMSQEASRQAIYDYLYFHMVPGPQTLYRGRERLLPGSFLVWNRGKLHAAPYWQMRYAEDEHLPFARLKEQFLTLVRKSVADAAQGDGIGAFLSGGTDSSTVAGMLGEVAGEAPRTYSIGFDSPGYDEMSYARIAARHFGTRHHEYYVTPDDVVAAIPLIAAVHDQPFGNASAVPTYYCAKLARDDGVGTLLGGDGGDELFGGNERYATQYLYSLYGDLPRVLREAIVQPVISLFPNAGIAGKLQRYIATASMSMPARYDHYNLLERIGPAAILTRDFLSAVRPDLPAVQVAQAYRGSHAKSLINRMLALDLRYTLADNDLPKVARSCELAGVDARFPLLNDELVAFSARLPANLKLRGTRLRYFFKASLRGFLPAEIISKTKHGFGLPFGPWSESHPRLRQMVHESLTGLKRRDIVRPEFIDKLTGDYVKSHPGYYGTMVWLLLMLEQWLRHHRITL